MENKEDLGNRIYNILEKDCKAPAGLRKEFINTLIKSSNRIVEFRFSGVLGIGGKIYIERNRIRVDCYRENKTPELAKLIDEVNDKISKEIYGE